MYHIVNKSNISRRDFKDKRFERSLLLRCIPVSFIIYLFLVMHRHPTFLFLVTVAFNKPCELMEGILSFYRYKINELTMQSLSSPNISISACNLHKPYSNPTLLKVCRAPLNDQTFLLQHHNCDTQHGAWGDLVKRCH